MESGQHWDWGVKQVKELGVSKGIIGVIGAGTGSGKEEERGEGDWGCLVGMGGAQGDLWGSRAIGMSQWGTGKSWTIRK